MLFLIPQLLYSQNYSQDATSWKQTWFSYLVRGCVTLPINKSVKKNIKLGEEEGVKREAVSFSLDSKAVGKNTK